MTRVRFSGLLWSCISEFSHLMLGEERFVGRGAAFVCYAIGVYDSGMITVAETGPYQRKAMTLLSGEERAELISYLSAFPAAGVLIQGTGGVRKLRWARAGRGKSAGVRVIYYFHSERMPLYLLAVFGKNEKADLSAEERAALAKAVRALVSHWRLNDGQGIH